LNFLLSQGAENPRFPSKPREIMPETKSTFALFLFIILQHYSAPPEKYKTPIPPPVEKIKTKNPEPISH